MGCGSNPAVGGCGTAEERAPTARRLAWAAVAFLGCAFSYSLGWQNGWCSGASGLDKQFKQYNEIRASRAAAGADTPSVELADEPADSA